MPTLQSTFTYEGKIDSSPVEEVDVVVQYPLYTALNLDDESHDFGGSIVPDGWGSITFPQKLFNKRYSVAISPVSIFGVTYGPLV